MIAQKKYSFTSDWVSHQAEGWSKHLAEYKNKPGANYLEIGSHEGRSLLWMLENIFTHATATATAIDCFQDKVESTLKSNLLASGHSQKVHLVNLQSQIALRQNFEKLFDVAYVDGSHLAIDVFLDAALAFSHVKIGGIIIFDDYLLYADKYSAEFRPQIAIDAFMTCFSEELELLEQGYTVILKKIKPLGSYVNRVGLEHAYFWDKNILIEVLSKKILDLNKDEISLVEKYLKSKILGETWSVHSQLFWQNADWKKLSQKIGLSFLKKSNPLFLNTTF